VNEIIQVLGVFIFMLVIVLIVYVVFKKASSKKQKQLTNRQLPSKVKKLKYGSCHMCDCKKVIIIDTDGFDKDVVECIKCKEVFNWYGDYVRRIKINYGR